MPDSLARAAALAVVLLAAIASSASARVGLVQTGGAAWYQDTPFSAYGWNLFSSNVRQMALSDNRAAVLQNDNMLWYQDATFSAGGWWPVSSNVKQFAMADNRMAIVDNNGTAWYQDAPFAANKWLMISSNVNSITLGDNRVGIISNTGAAHVQSPPYSAGGWQQIHTAAKQLVLADNRAALLTTGDGVYVQDAPFAETRWGIMTSNARQIAMAGNKLAIVSNPGVAWVASAPYCVCWTELASGVSQVSLGDGRIGIIYGTGGVSWQSAPFSAGGWMPITGDGKQVVMTKADKTPPTATLSGGLYDARLNLSMTSGYLSVSADDDYTGAQKVDLYEVLSNGTRVRVSGLARTCASVCTGTATTWTYTLDPVALGWTTGNHKFELVVTDPSRNKQTYAWSADYYDTSWRYGNSNRVIDTDPEAGAVRVALGEATSDAQWNAIWNGMTAAEQARTEQAWTIENDQLVRDVSTGKIYLHAAGAVALVTNDTVAARLELDMASAVDVAATKVASYRRAYDITEAALDTGDEPATSSTDTGDRSLMTVNSYPAPDSGYFHEVGSNFVFTSGDGKAEFRGTLHWYRNKWHLWKRYLQWQGGSRSQALMPGYCHSSSFGTKWGGHTINWSWPPGISSNSQSSPEGYLRCPSSSTTSAADTSWGGHRPVSPEGKTKGNIKEATVTICSATPTSARLHCRSKKGNRRGVVVDI